MLTKDDFEYLLDKQALLDTNIRNTKQISYDEWMSPQMEDMHKIAFRVELGEFVNEIKEPGVFKYWANKSTDRHKMLDEAIDVLHFYLLISNKSDIPLSDVQITLEILRAEEFDDMSETKLVNDMLKAISISYPMVCVFVLLDRYGFTRQDILDQYHTKNRENFRRLQNGY